MKVKDGLSLGNPEYCRLSVDGPCGTNIPVPASKNPVLISVAPIPDAKTPPSNVASTGGSPPLSHVRSAREPLVSLNTISSSHLSETSYVPQKAVLMMEGTASILWTSVPSKVPSPPNSKILFALNRPAPPSMCSTQLPSYNPFKSLLLH